MLLRLKKFIETNNKTKKVIFSINQDTFFNTNADKYLKQGQSAQIGIELKGGLELGKSFIDYLKLFYHVASIGDSRLLVIHLASMANSLLKEEEILNASVTPGYLKLSIGI